MLVKDLMAQQVATVGPEEPVSVAARALSRNNVGCLPVCTADGRLRSSRTGTSSCAAWPPTRTRASSSCARS